MDTLGGFDWRNYSTGIEVLHGAIQQMSLLPLAEMGEFLTRAIAATRASGDLSRRKILAARRQLELIEATRRYFSEVRELLRAGPRLEAG
jgi:hypothetical protein